MLIDKIILWLLNSRPWNQWFSTLKTNLFKTIRTIAFIRSWNQDLNEKINTFLTIEFVNDRIFSAWYFQDRDHDRRELLRSSPCVLVQMKGSGLNLYLLTSSISSQIGGVTVAHSSFKWWFTTCSIENANFEPYICLNHHFPISTHIKSRGNNGLMVPAVSGSYPTLHLQ